MGFVLVKPTIYDTQEFVKKGTLLIAVETDHDLTAGRIYMTTKNQGENTFHDCLFVINDKGVEQDYTGEYFTLYEGEIVSS